MEAREVYSFIALPNRREFELTFHTESFQPERADKDSQESLPREQRFVTNDDSIPLDEALDYICGKSVEEGECSEEKSRHFSPENFPPLEGKRVLSPEISPDESRKKKKRNSFNQTQMSLLY